MSRAVVTGARGGIGRAVVRRLLEDGWDVLASDVVEEPPLPTGVQFVRADLGTPEGRRTLIDASGQEPIHALVNNAAFSHDSPLKDTSDAAIAHSLRINLQAPMALSRELLPCLREAAGAVVNIASVHAIVTSSNVAAYAASKGGLTAFTRAAAVELGPEGIRVNAVLPGAIDTRMLMAGLSRQNRDPALALESLANRTPLRRIGHPEEIAYAIGFLIDPIRAGFITGQTLVVDGGASARLATE